MVEVERNRKFEQVFFPIYIVLAVVISCIAGLTLYTRYDAYITNSYHKTLVDVTQLVEHEFPLLTDTQRLEELLQEDSDVYWDIQRTVQNIQASCGLSYIFIWQKKADGWHFLLSSDYPQGTPLEKIRELHTEYIPVREQAYQSKTMILTAKPVTNQWGTFMSVFRPLVKDGEVACILGAAIDISSVKSLHAQAIHSLIGAFLVSLVISVIFALISRRIINRLEKMIRKRSDELEAQTKLANEASQAKSRFLANMSHEIRTPMNAIIGLSDLMRTDNLDNTQRVYFEDIKKMSNSLLHIINDILDFSKVDAGKMELIPVNFNVQLLFDLVCSLSQFLATGKGLQWRSSLDKAIPSILYGDEIRIRQILTNVVNNAVKYTREGYVNFTLTWGKRGSEGDDQDYLIAVVEDSGIGIKAEDIPRLFDPFQQLDVRKNRGIASTGLGLVITKSLLEMMGGSIEVESEYEKGSRFQMYIPLVVGDAAQVADSKSTEPMVMATAPVKVLVVDDTPENLIVARGFLATHHLIADTASSGAAAIRMVQETRYDLVFMDHMMPEMDGVEVTRRIRALEGAWFQAMPIIALSANAVTGARELFLEAGMQDFLSKPIEAGRLNTILATWLPVEKLTQQSLDEAPQTVAASVPADVKDQKEKNKNIIDREIGVRHAIGDETLYQQLLETFQHEHDSDYQKLKDLLAEGAIQTAHRLIHTLKSSSALIGAKQLEQSAQVIETCLAEQSSGNGPDAVSVEAMETLEAELNSVLEVLHQTTPESNTAEPVIEHEIASDENHKKFTILVADDDNANVMILYRILSPEYTVLTAGSGESALKYAIEDQPDIILLDIILPDMNGFDVLIKLKENSLTKEIPVIIITGLNSEQDEEKGLCLSAVDYITKPFNNTIIRARIKTHIDIINHRRVIEKLSLIDPLTDIPNRRAFNDRIQMEWKRAIRDKNPLSFLMIDLDNFKHYNDTYGHLQGDRLLKTVAHIFVDSAKRPADMSIRWGGEEFAVLLPHTDIKAAHLIAERIRSRVEATQVPITGGTLMTSITVSIGLASIVPTQDSSINDFIALADKYLYQAKDMGKNRIGSIETTEAPVQIPQNPASFG
ncbi:MAG: diguanylate cyclase [Treponema sp.]|jgi:diguanylate cyclase (GGDEF)-like protein|nr:diguanylate cyclase [Treponema sp.]